MHHIAYATRRPSSPLLQNLVLWDGPPPLSGTGRLPVLIPRTRRSGAMRIVMLGIDLGKNLCSLAGLDETGAVVLRRRMKRASVLPFTAQLEICTVAMDGSLLWGTPSWPATRSAGAC